MYWQKMIGKMRGIVLFLIFILLNTNAKCMDYKVLDYFSACGLRDKLNGVFIEQIDYNFAKVFSLLILILSFKITYTQPNKRILSNKDPILLNVISKKNKVILKEEFEGYLNCRCLESFINLLHDNDSTKFAEFLSFNYFYYSLVLSKIGLNLIDSVGDEFLKNEVTGKLLKIKESEFGISAISGYKFCKNALLNQKKYYSSLLLSKFTLTLLE
jgi:hypothetical protein